MFNWISPFNYDFALAAIPIQIILLVFYGVRRNLPIRQSSCFWLVIFKCAKLSRRMKACLLSFNLLLLFGIIIRKQFYHMLVTSYFSILSILIIYLTSENPDLIKMFQHSNMEIVVEGIETEEMKDKMAEMGCDYEQGYYFSKPLPPAEFIRYMGSR